MMNSSNELAIMIHIAPYRSSSFLQNSLKASVFPMHIGRRSLEHMIT